MSVPWTSRCFRGPVCVALAGTCLRPGHADTRFSPRLNFLLLTGVRGGPLMWAAGCEARHHLLLLMTRKGVLYSILNLLLIHQRAVRRAIWNCWNSLVYIGWISTGMDWTLSWSRGRPLSLGRELSVWRTVPGTQRKWDSKSLATFSFFKEMTV